MSERRRWYAWAEPTYAVVALALLTLGPVYQLRVRFGGPLFGPDLIDDPFVQQTFVALYAVALALLAHRRRTFDEARDVVLSLGALWAVIAASTLWSHDRTRTFSQAVLFAGTVVFGLYLADRYPMRTVARLVFLGLHAGALVAAFAIARNWEGSRDPNGAWTGIYFNRNSLGPVAVLGLLSAAAVAGSTVGRARRDRRPTSLAWLAATAAAGLLDVVLARGARSLTPMLGLAAAVAGAALASGLASLVRRGRLTAVRATRVLWALGATAFAVLLVGWRSFAVATGRSPTLESRTGLWGLVVDTWWKRPLTGFGWTAMWTDLEFQRQVTFVANHPLPTAHSGYLEVLLGGGILGAVALLVLLVVVIRRTWRVERVLVDHAAVWAIGLVGYGLAVNLLETYIGSNLLVWVLVVMAAATSVGIVGRPDVSSARTDDGSQGRALPLDHGRD